jgi:hypothetical protein
MATGPSRVPDPDSWDSSLDWDIDAHRRNRKERIQDWAIGALILACIIAVCMIIMLQYPIPLRETPVIIHDVAIPKKTIFCPGDKYTYTTELEFTKPSILSLYIGIVDKDTGDTLPGTVVNVGPIPRKDPATIKEGSTFVIPDLPPGNYERIMAIDAEHVDSVPIFFSLPFKIGERCPE